MGRLPDAKRKSGAEIAIGLTHLFNVVQFFGFHLLSGRTMNWVSYGPRALLFQFAERLGDEAFACQRAMVAELERHSPAGLIEYVPAFTKILLEFDPNIAPEPVRLADELLQRFEVVAHKKLPEMPAKEIPVRYDGEDLAALAEAKRMTVEEVCELHCAPVYKVYMLGFSPGFPYLGDLDPRLHTPRLAAPRPAVRAGSVAIEHHRLYATENF